MKHIVLLSCLLGLFQQTLSSADAGKAPRSLSDAIKIVRPSGGPTSWIFSQQDARPLDVHRSFAICMIEHPNEKLATILARRIMGNAYISFQQDESDAKKELKDAADVQDSDKEPVSSTLIALLSVEKKTRKSLAIGRVVYLARGTFEHRELVPFRSKNFLLSKSKGSLHDFAAQPDIAALIKKDGVAAVQEQWQEHLRSTNSIGFELDLDAVEEVWSREVSLDKK